MQTIRAFLLFEAVAFIIAALAHAGVLLTGYEHPQARIAESVIAITLLVGFVASWLRPKWARKAGLWAQGFALLGTLVGVFTILVGVGPRTLPDVLYHACIIAVLIWGLTVAVRMRAAATDNVDPP